MYTGTLIKDLMTLVDQVLPRSRQQERIALPGTINPSQSLELPLTRTESSLSTIFTVPPNGQVLFAAVDANNNG